MPTYEAFDIERWIDPLCFFPYAHTYPHSDDAVTLDTNLHHEEEVRVLNSGNQYQY